MSWLSILTIAVIAVGVFGALVTLLTGFLFDKKKQRICSGNKADLGS